MSTATIETRAASAVDTAPAAPAPESAAPTAAESAAPAATDERTAPVSIGRASMLLTGATLAASAVNYALNLLLARWLEPSAFGDANLIVTLMLGITAIAVALQLLAAGRVSAAPDATSEHRRRLLARAWTVGTGIAVVVAAAGSTLRDLTSSASAAPFVLLAIGLPFYLAQAVERGVLQGHLRFGKLAATLLVEAVTRLGVALALVLAGFGVVGATAGITASFVATWACGRVAVGDLVGAPFPTPRSDRAITSTTSTDRLATQATLLLLVGQIVINNGDVVIAKSLFDADTAGVYSVVALIGRAIFFLSWSVVTAAFPHAARGDGHHVQRQAVRTVAAMSAAMTVAVAAAAPALAPIVFGEGYRAAGPLFAPYAIATSLFAVANVYATLGVATGRRAPAVVIVAGAIGQTLLLLAVANDATAMVWLQVAAMGALLAGSWSQNLRSRRSTSR